MEKGAALIYTGAAPVQAYSPRQAQVFLSASPI